MRGGLFWADEAGRADRAACADQGARCGQSRGTLSFGRRICGVSQPARVIEAIAEGMRQTLEAAKGDERVPAQFLAQMRSAWEQGMEHAA